MTYQELMSVSLGTLALITLNSQISFPIRLSCYDALTARILEADSVWPDLTSVTKANILGALALDFTSE
jgi:hypothetical protein